MLQLEIQNEQVVPAGIPITKMVDGQVATILYWPDCLYAGVEGIIVMRVRQHLVQLALRPLDKTYLCWIDYFRHEGSGKGRVKLLPNGTRLVVNNGEV